MEELIKRCERCGEVIAREFECDWWSFLRIKYCPTCKVVVQREQWAARSRAYRKRKKENKKMAELEERDRIQKEQVGLLEEENAQLRRMLIELSERVDALQEGAQNVSDWFR